MYVFYECTYDYCVYIVYYISYLAQILRCYLSLRFSDQFLR